MIVFPVHTTCPIIFYSHGTEICNYVAQVGVEEDAVILSN
jgi:hypothetical protein